MNCPNPDTCVLCVHNGKVHCETHKQNLQVDQGPYQEDGLSKVWENAATIPMHHVLYVAARSPMGDGWVLIDEEQ